MKTCDSFFLSIFYSQIDTCRIRCYNILMKKSAITVILVIIVALLCGFAFGCKANENSEPATCNHVWQDVESDYNREATVTEEGRVLRKCALCGMTLGFVIPKIKLADGTTAPDYKPLLNTYKASYGDTLGEIAKKYFTAGWSFDTDDKEKVGLPTTDEGRVFAVTFKSQEDGYNEVKTDVTLVVGKRALTADDILIGTADIIASTAKTLEDVDIFVKAASPTAGTIAWAPNQDIMRGQSYDYTYIFTPEESDLYAIYTGTLTLSAELSDK